MKLNWSHWLYTLLKTVIGGVAATGSAWLGTLVGNQVDGNIPVLQFNQLWSVLLSSSILNLFFFLKQSPLPEDEDAKKTSPLPLLLLLGFIAIGLSGCASFTTTQTDVSSYDNEGRTTRTITTKATATTLFESKSALANFKASQTDKTQAASVGSLNQESNATNTVNDAAVFLGTLIKSAK